MAVRKAANTKVNRKALIVAINDYPGDANDLPSCRQDAEAITELLKSAPYEFQEIRTWIDTEATIKNVTDGLNWLFAQGSEVNSEDRLVLYYSGHGFRTEKDGVLRECLCLFDGFLFDEELKEKTQSLPANVLTVILDSCHSGGMDKHFFELLSVDEETGKTTERVKVKTWIPQSEADSKSFFLETESLPVQRFGCAVNPSITTGEGEGKAWQELAKGIGGESQVNGLLITACQADQTASASSSQTEEKSAFTFCLLKALKKLASESSPDTLSSSVLFDAVGQELKALKFKQIPALIEPPNSPGLKSKSFITLQSICQTSEVAQPSIPGTNGSTTVPSKDFKPSDTTEGDTSMPVTQLNNPTSINQADEKFWTQVISAAVSAVPGIIEAVRGKDFQPSTSMITTQAPVAEEKILPFLVPILASTIPTIVEAVRGKDFQPSTSMITTQAPVADEKIFPLIGAALAATIPSIVQAVRS